jgi:prepilin-type N-terminal cleavage/methylation domain-containing protein
MIGIIMKHLTNDSRGFSLVELSIVLVILGLLTGGILSGQSLIRASELRSITGEYQRYTTAISAFRDKYFAMPGDFNKASDFGWGALNGDGDGVIENTAVAGTNEISTFWIHLASAGLMEGSYTNIANTTLTPGVNNPRSKLSNAGWNVLHLGGHTVGGVSTPPAGTTVVDTGTYFAGSYGNVFTVGSGTSAILPGPILKPEEAWNLDTKIDDGRPDQGTVLTLESQGSTTAGAGSPGCSDRASATTALAASNYRLDATGTNCSLVYKSGY